MSSIALFAEPATTFPRIFPPPKTGLAPNHAWYDFGMDRHHVVLIPLDRREDALAMPESWRVMVCPLWYLCTRIEVGGAAVARN